MSFAFIPGVSTHARQRAVQRLGRDPAQEDWLAAVLSIIDGKAPLLQRNGTAELRLIQLGSIEAQVWWIPEQAIIATIIEVGQCVHQPERRAAAMKQASRRVWGPKEPYRRARRDWSADP